MKTYRIIYWLGSMTTERFVKARSEKEAEDLFRSWIGMEVNIVSIAETV